MLVAIFETTVAGSIACPRPISQDPTAIAPNRLSIVNSSRLDCACRPLDPIAVGNQIVGGLLDLIRRQFRFASRRGHIVHRWKGGVGSTAG
jgi:hypothetical protein